MNTGYIRLGVSNARNKLAEMLYIKWGVDMTRPVQVYCIVNNTCNARCLMCPSWKKVKSDELSASDWIKALQSIKKISGVFHVNFSGGEPLLKRDFFEILEFCNKEKIMAGFTTNGLLLTKRNINKLLNLNIANINISIDSMDESIHDTMRGVPRLLGIVKKNIEYLASENLRLKKNIRIILKPTVGSLNINDLDKIVNYSKEMKLTGVNFQPIYKWTNEAEQMFNVDRKELSNTINRLTEMKNEGYNILNSISSIQDWQNHFEEKIPKMNSPCSVALRNLTIFANGDIYLCALCNSYIGNISVDEVRSLWKSESTKKLRKKLVSCKRICSVTCAVKRNWLDYIYLFFRFIKG